MGGAIRHYAVLLGAVLLSTVQCPASDHDWTVVTMARDGSWGVGTHSLLSRAIAGAVRNCNAMAKQPTDCGAQFTTTKGGWTVVRFCGDHRVIATGSNLAEAEKAATAAEIELQVSYVPDLPPCQRVATICDHGQVVHLHMALYSRAR
jgi:hypothetical protein